VSHLRQIGSTLLLCALVLGLFHRSSPLAPQTGATWYVRPGGNDSGGCDLPAAPCATLQAAIGKAAAGDTILVATGAYHSASNPIVSVDKSLILLGGWNTAFTAVTGRSTVDGDGYRRSMSVSAGTQVELDRFILQDGYHPINEHAAGGLHNEGTLTVTNSIIRTSDSFGSAGGVSNWGGRLVIEHTLIIDNPGGGIFNQSYYHGEGVLILNSSVVAHNGGRGGIYNGPFEGSRVYINNSFIFSNRSTFYGSINNNSDLTRVHNSTIWNNYTEYGTAGLSNMQGSLIIANSVIGHNANYQGAADCGGTITSEGYNLVETSCGFSPVAGDQQGVTAELIELGALVAALGTSPVIDAGNPAGCVDSAGAPLTTDQRGVTRPLDGDQNASSICDIGAYEFDPEQPVIQSFMPIAPRVYCVDTTDEFDNPASGWPVGEYALVNTEYLNSEYRVHTKLRGYAFSFRAPGCGRIFYSVEADMRWEAATEGRYGLLFGAASDWSHYFLFVVEANTQSFWLYERHPNGALTQRYEGQIDDVATGTHSNHLRVTRLNQKIEFQINELYSGSYSTTEPPITEPTWAGVVVIASGGDDNLDARFDNFALKTIYDGGGAFASSGDGGAAVPPVLAVLAEEINQWIEPWP
jgi:hypothetical protein